VLVLVLERFGARIAMRLLRSTVGGRTSTTD
jgi:hypothetical protein